MASTKIGDPYRCSDVQPARNDRDHQQSEAKQNGHASEASLRAHQRRADAEIRRVKGWERWHTRETTIVRRVSERHPAPQQNARDHHGEVA